MPSFEEIFSRAVLDRFERHYRKQEEKEPLFYEHSLSKNVRCVPIKPDVKEAREAEKDRKFVPLGILGQNIGSNNGLLKILMDHRLEELDKRHIPALLVDCNIYWRIMKVLFCLLVLLHSFAHPYF